MYDDRPIDILPGIFSESSEYAASNRYVSGLNVRFWKGYPEKIGSTSILSEDLLPAPARGIVAWQSLGSDQYIAFGGAEGVHLLFGGQLFDISPTGANGFITLIITTSADTTQRVLLHFDGADASTTFTDSNAGGSAHTWTAAGNAQIDTAQSVFGGASGLFDGTGDYITTTDHADFTLGSGAFTIDCRVRPAADGSLLYVAGQLNSGGAANADSAWYISRTAANKIEFGVVASTTVTTVTSTTNVVAGAWYHVEVVRTSNTLKLFINGTQEGGDVSFSSTVNNSTSALGVGAAGDLVTTPWNGWIDEFRLSVGIARHTANFTPPTAAYGTAFTDGETVTATGGGTAIVVSSAGSTVNVSGQSGTFTGTLTGGSSGWSATIVSTAAGGAVDGSTTFGYGEGGYGSSSYGGIATIYATTDHPTTWTFANWGEDLIANPRGGKTYVWDESAGTSSNLTMITNVPSVALGCFMSDINRTLVLYGAHDGSSTDPLNIRWCDAEDYTVWTAASTNTAGSIRCEIGSEIIGVISTRGGHLISTDAACYFFRYVGAPFIFDNVKVATGPAMISPHCGIDADGIAYFFGEDGFYGFDGAVRDLPCDVQEAVFGNLNRAQRFKIFCGTIQKFNEVIWFYCSAGSVEIDSCVAFNTAEKVWWLGNVARTSWIDTNVVLNYPVGAGSDGTIYAHEVSRDTTTAYTLETADMQIGDGSFLHARKLIPNYDRISGDHSVTIVCRGYPARSETTKGPYAITSSTDNLSVRARGRNVRLRFSGTGDFRGGRWQSRVTQHGKRP